MILRAFDVKINEKKLEIRPRACRRQTKFQKFKTDVSGNGSSARPSGLREEEKGGSGAQRLRGSILVTS